MPRIEQRPMQTRRYRITCITNYGDDPTSLSVTLKPVDGGPVCFGASDGVFDWGGREITISDDPEVTGVARVEVPSWPKIIANDPAEDHLPDVHYLFPYDPNFELGGFYELGRWTTECVWIFDDQVLLRVVGRL